MVKMSRKNKPITHPKKKAPTTLTLEKTQQENQPEEPASPLQNISSWRNVSKNERLVSGLIGSGLLMYGLPQFLSLRAQFSNAAGAYLLARGVTGHCPLYRALDIDSTPQGRMHHKGLTDPHPWQIRQLISTFRSPLEVYEFCRDPLQMAQFFPLVKHVEKTDDFQSVWTFTNRFKKLELSVNVELTQESSPHSLTWMAFPDSKMRITGHLQFNPGPSQEGTEIVATVHIIPPAGLIGTALMRMMSPFHDSALGEILHHMKEFLESDEVGRNQSTLLGKESSQDRPWSKAVKNYLQVRTIKSLANRSAL